MNTVSQPATPYTPEKTTWKRIVARYEKPALHRSAWQMANTLAGYGALWVAMYFSMAISYWIALALAIPTAGFLLRLFIIFHDCGHGAFFRSRKANDTLGVLTGILVFTPYAHWRHKHARHHATAGDLDRRGVGDVWTLTVQEYLAAPGWKRCAYRLVRNPLVLFCIAPFFLLVVLQRFPYRRGDRREWTSVLSTNLGIMGMVAGLTWLVGIQAYLLIQVPVLMVASSVGVWLFYVQHQFEDTYWEHRDRWNYVEAALQGSSYYQLPRVLQWFTGNIGFHHIHHLSPGIPNYNLERCHRADPLFQRVPHITLGASLKAMTYRLWDEQRNRLVGFGSLRIHRHPGGSR
ncbi:MAG TPA: fatty acid desaturase [Candidatus Baltobacteraceae bacterium]|nr:fatty acid desaturase [Candidatus Baltobacteraceae bacterium]